MVQLLEGCVTYKEQKITHRGDSIPSHMCLNAKAAAAAESSDILMPLTRISMTEGKNESPLDALSSHFE